MKIRQYYFVKVTATNQWHLFSGHGGGGRGNVIHNVEREGELSGRGNVRGNMSEGQMSMGKCPLSNLAKRRKTYLVRTIAATDNAKT